MIAEHQIFTLAPPHLRQLSYGLQTPSIGQITDRHVQDFLRAEYVSRRALSRRRIFSTPPKSFFKGLFQGSDLGEALRKMSSVKSNPEGLKVVECERGVGGKNAPIRYIPEQDPVQDALKKQRRPHTSS